MIISDLSYLETVLDNSVNGGNEVVANSYQVTNINGKVTENISGPYTKEVLPDGTTIYKFGDLANPFILTLSPSLVGLFE